MLIKVIILTIIFIILASLGSGLFYLVRDKGQSTRVAKALTIRIGLSVVLFILLMLAFAFGLISPHPV